MLSPSQRSLRGAIGAHIAHSRHNGLEITQAARDTFRNTLDARLLAEIDPNGELSPEERERRLEHGRKAYFLRMAFLSAKVRRERKEQGLPPTIEDPGTLRKIAALLTVEGGGGNG